MEPISLKTFKEIESLKLRNFETTNKDVRNLKPTKCSDLETNKMLGETNKMLGGKGMIGMKRGMLTIWAIN